MGNDFGVRKLNKMSQLASEVQLEVLRLHSKLGSCKRLCWWMWPSYLWWAVLRLARHCRRSYKQAAHKRWLYLRSAVCLFEIWIMPRLVSVCEDSPVISLRLHHFPFLLFSKGLTACLFARRSLQVWHKCSVSSAFLAVCAPIACLMSLAGGGEVFSLPSLS